MEPAGTQRRISLISLAASLALVGIFWTVELPRTEYYKQYQREKKVKQRLREITPTANADVEINVLFSGQETITIMGIYVSDANCADVKTHYQKEFIKHGFTYIGEVDHSTPPNSSSTFSAPEYDAILTCSKTDTPRHLYTIDLTWTKSS